MTILDTIVADKQTELKTYTDTPTIKAHRQPIPFKAKVLSDPSMSIISEIKRASPSKGDINTGVDITKQAQAYQDGGASAISVLTEKTHFKGSLDDLALVRECVDIPILNKDFIISKDQITRAYNAGCDIILLIVAILSDEDLKAFYDYAYSLDLEVIVEVHDEDEMLRALQLNPEIIGINNRNLKKFEVDIKQTEDLLAKYFRDDILFISESGIKTAEDAKRMKKAGAKALLVGETLMTSGDPKEALEHLRV